MTGQNKAGWMGDAHAAAGWEQVLESNLTAVRASKAEALRDPAGDEARVRLARRQFEQTRRYRQEAAQP